MRTTGRVPTIRPFTKRGSVRPTTWPAYADVLETETASPGGPGAGDNDEHDRRNRLKHGERSSPGRHGSARVWRVAVAFAVPLVLALAGEGLFRGFPSLTPPQQRIKIQQRLGDYSFVPDPDLGSRQTPGRDETWRTLDFTYRIETDSLGFPNRLPWPDQVDAVVLGNSLVIGPGVGIDGQFTTLLERRFPGRRFLNLGLAGASPEHQDRIYRAHAAALEPHLVVALLWVASDVDNTVHFARWLAAARERDYFEFRTRFNAPRGSLALIGRARDLLSRSYLLGAVYYLLEALRRADGFAEEVRFGDGRTIYLSVRQQRSLAAGAERPDAPDLRQEFIEPLRRLHDEAEGRGGRFVVVLLPSKEEVHGAAQRPEVLRSVDDVRRWLSEAGLPVLDLYEPFASHGAEPLFFPTDIHLNAAGNRQVAEEIGDWIEARGVFED